MFIFFFSKKNTIVKSVIQTHKNIKSFNRGLKSLAFKAIIISIRHGVSPSGKAADFDSVIPRFKS